MGLVLDLCHVMRILDVPICNWVDEPQAMRKDLVICWKILNHTGEAIFRRAWNLLAGEAHSVGLTVKGDQENAILSPLVEPSTAEVAGRIECISIYIIRRLGCLSHMPWRSKFFNVVFYFSVITMRYELIIIQLIHILQGYFIIWKLEVVSGV